MPTTETHAIYTVAADRQTGEWIGYPQPTGERMDRTAFLALDNGDDTHRYTYEEVDGKNGVTRLILITWVNWFN